MKVRSVVVGTGSCIPARRVTNEDLRDREFFGPDGKRIEKPGAQILEQFESITGIRERRYAEDGQVTSDLATLAAREALDSSGIDPESLDVLIVAHNFGDVRHANRNSDLVPALAARVKAQLKIAAPRTAAFDLIFGCPGWLQGVIQCDAMIRAGDAKRAMVIGAETLSRVSDPHDRDSLIYADGAGAVILEARESEAPVGILGYAVRSDTLDHSTMLTMGPSYKNSVFLEAIFLKMEGRKLYRYALQNVAGAIAQALERAGVALADVNKVLIHQANGKMDEAILQALYDQAGTKPPAGVMPMTIGWLGNSSVATVPTLLDLLLKGRLDGHAVGPGDVLVFASVGAGMNINAVVYRVHGS
ncbi:MAG: ketoacyl-ACP synthase III [Vicinamibacteria bacterium]|jgi:3-oxoacyl-[acyl-carrier-protein] synthase-3|nr:ketoacyl-ACP synthase III [Vicinamibacteria bacterium]